MKKSLLVFAGALLAPVHAESSVVPGYLAFPVDDTVIVNCAVVMPKNTEVHIAIAAVDSDEEDVEFFVAEEGEESDESVEAVSEVAAIEPYIEETNDDSRINDVLPAGVRSLEAVPVIFTETDEALIATVDLSSLDMRNMPNDIHGQLKVWVDEAGLTIASKVKQETCYKNETTSLDILSTRTIDLPCAVDYEKVTATSDAAEKKLVLHMPRKQEVAQPAVDKETGSEA